MKKILIITLLLNFASCIPDGTRRTLATISSGNNITTCEDSFFDLTSGDTCQSACDEDTQQEATEEQISEIVNNSDVADDIKEIVQTSKGVCIEKETIPTRPSDSIFINGDFCVCKAGKVASVNADSSCSATCATKSDDFAKLYGSVTVGPLESGNDSFKNLYGWCTNSIDNNQVNNPSCQLVLRNTNNETIPINIEVTSGSNRFSVPLTNATFGETYSFKIQETGTQVENAVSDIKQLRMKEPEDDGGIILDDELHLTLINQYTCILRTTSVNEATSQNFYVDYARYHYYQQATSPVLPLAPGAATRIFCHDYVKEGNVNDKVQYARLETIPGHFTVWDVQDPRFLKDGDNLTVDYLIKEKLEKMGVTNPTLKSYFGTISTCVAPDSADNICVGPDILGFVMTPFTDSTGKSFCPGEAQYNDQTKPEFVAIGEVVGTPTEGLYFAEGEREVVSITNSDGSTTETEIQRDLILVRENILKKIWFHLSSTGVPYKPTSSTERQATYFYWPPNYNTPFVQQKGNQKLYTVKGPTEIGTNGRTTEVPTSLIPHDRKAYCVPATSN